jgi:hypothetical protein
MTPMNFRVSERVEISSSSERMPVVHERLNVWFSY